MRILLDTHVLLWWLLDDDRLSQPAREAVSDGQNTVLVSSASAFEIATKHRIGKLGVMGFDPADLGGLLRRGRMEPLPITLEHALAAGTMGGSHRDPFDRLLIAQAQLEQVPIVTVDPVFGSYPLNVIW